MTGPGHHPFPWRVTGVVALIVVAAAVVSAVLLGQNRVGSGSPAPVAASATAQPRPVGRLDTTSQVTVLFTVRDVERSAVSTVLIGVDPSSGAVVELMLPRDLLLPTNPPTRLEQAEDPTLSRTADEPLETLLGVRIDGLVDLDRLAWNGLIDGTGSRVDPVAAQNPGAFGLVLDDVLASLPYEPQIVGELLTGLGSMARSSVTNEDASAILALIGRGVRKREVTRAALPVTYLRSGEARVAVADVAATEALVRELFPESLLEPGHDGQLRVILEPAGSTVGSTTWARRVLADAGLGVVVAQPATDAVDRTRVLTADTSPAARSAGEEVAAVLGLPESSIVVDDAPDSTVDVRVLLGPDAPLPPRP